MFSSEKFSYRNISAIILSDVLLTRLISSYRAPTTSRPALDQSRMSPPAAKTPGIIEEKLPGGQTKLTCQHGSEMCHICCVDYKMINDMAR